jgi:hypothetical protein
MTIDKEIFTSQEKQKNLQTTAPEENNEESYQEVALPPSNQEEKIEELRSALQAEVKKSEQPSNLSQPINTTSVKATKEFSLQNFLPRLLRRKLNKNKIVNDPATAHDPYYDEE